MDSLKRVYCEACLFAPGADLKHQGMEISVENWAACDFETCNEAYRWCMTIKESICNANMQYNTIRGSSEIRWLPSLAEHANNNTCVGGANNIRNMDLCV